MKHNQLALPTLALALGASALLLAQNGPPPDQPQQGYGQDHRDNDHGGWDAPPPEFRDMQRHGFHDGIQAARGDVENHRRPDVDMAAEFRQPPVPPEARDEYRDGFRRGYDMALSHFREGMGGRPMPMAGNGPPQDQPRPDQPQQGYGQDHPEHDRGGWDAPPQEFRDVQRQGFHDGVEAGRSDFENHQDPNVNRKRNFRRPPVPPPDRDEYREGFRRGYDMAFSHFREDRDRH